MGAVGVGDVTSFCLNKRVVGANVDFMGGTHRDVVPVLS